MIMNKTIKKPLNSALYIRVSTDRQAKEGDSLEAQEDALKEYAKKHGYIIVDKYIDGGESGQKFNRTNFQRMLNDVKNGKIDIIIMTKLDRWFRNPADFYKTVEILKKYKVDWKTIWEDYDTTTASGEFWLNMSLSMARMEAKRTGERIESVFDYKYNVQKTACTGNVVYGYKIGKDKRIEIDETKSKYIRELFNHYIECNNLLKTVRWFQENCEVKSYGSIKIYLTNTTYIGQFVRKKTGEILKDYYPRILDDKTFYEVQNLLKKNIKSKKNIGNTKPYIFSGLLKCKKCGYNLSGNTSHKNHYYRCKRAVEGITCNNKTMISELYIEKYLIDNIYNLLNKKIIEIEKINNSTPKKDANNIETINKKLRKLSDLYINEIIDIDIYKEQYKSLKDKLEEEIKSQKISNSNKVNLKEIKKILDKDILKNYEMLNNEEKRKVWVSIIDYIVIENKHDISVQLLGLK